MLIRTTSEPNQQAIPILIIAPIQNQQVMTESMWKLLKKSLRVRASHTNARIIHIEKEMYISLPYTCMHVMLIF